MKTKKVGRLKHSNERRSKNVLFWSKKDASKGENTLPQWILQNIVENEMFQIIAKFIRFYSYEMDFMKATVMLVKADEMYNISNFASRCLLVKRWRWSKFLLESTLERLDVYHASYLLRKKVRVAPAEKEFDIAI